MESICAVLCFYLVFIISLFSLDIGPPIYQHTADSDLAAHHMHMKQMQMSKSLSEINGKRGAGGGGVGSVTSER